MHHKCIKASCTLLKAKQQPEPGATIQPGDNWELRDDCTSYISFSLLFSAIWHTSIHGIIGSQLINKCKEIPLGLMSTWRHWMLGGIGKNWNRKAVSEGLFL